MTQDNLVGNDDCYLFSRLLAGAGGAGYSPARQQVFFGGQTIRSQLPCGALIPK
jgi:hypothetical protein